MRGSHHYGHTTTAMHETNTHTPAPAHEINMEKKIPLPTVLTRRAHTKSPRYHHDRTSQLRGSRTLALPETATVPSASDAVVEHRTRTSRPDDVTRAFSTSTRASTLSPTRTGRSNLKLWIRLIA